ncbi:MAG: hypothetical protein GY940_37255, partial [bacterium]|nr:hypothetical protein [bacterium]
DKRNLIFSGHFDSRDTFRTNWGFSNMAGFPPFADGSFTMGHDTFENNGMLRIMGFFTRKQPGRKKARGGAWYKKSIPIEKTFYLFTFDYLTKTGDEAPSLYLWKNIKEQHLPHTKKKWYKAVFILKNLRGKNKSRKPLFRVWGTGSLRVDNVTLIKITEEDFKLKVPYQLVTRPIPSNPEAQ